MRAYSNPQGRLVLSWRRRLRRKLQQVYGQSGNRGLFNVTRQQRLRESRDEYNRPMCANGRALCRLTSDFLPLSNFAVETIRTDGDLQWSCIPCQGSPSAFHGSAIFSI
jgi:hypothetical protein